jgi:hypothetical protein
MKQSAPEEVRLDQNHHVILAPGTKFVPSQIARDTAPIRGQILFDEIRRLNFCAGWLLRDGTEKQARSIIEIAKKNQLDHRYSVTDGTTTKVEIIRTIRIHLEQDRVEVITPKEQRWIALSTIRALDLSLTAEDIEDEARLDPEIRRAQVLRSLAELMMVGSPAGDLLEKISGSPILNPQPRLLLLGPDAIAWSLDRSTVFPELAAQGAVQSLANLLRFTGMLIGSVGHHQTTPETRSLWQNGDLAGIRRDTPEEQQARIEALHSWMQAGGTLSATAELGPSSEKL